MPEANEARLEPGVARRAAGRSRAESTGSAQVGGVGRAGRLLGIATKEKTRAPMREHQALVVGADGLPGERSHPAERAVTVLAREAWEAACHELGVELPWTLRRANLLVEGIDLAGRVGDRLHVGASILEISEDNPPCGVMDVLHAGLRVALQPDGRAGVACRVITPGEIRVGDRVELRD